MDLSGRPLLRFSNQPCRIGPQVQRDASVGTTQRPASGPDHLPHRDQLIEQLRPVVAHPHREPVAFQHGRRDGAALQLEDDLGQPVEAARLDADAVPGWQEPAEDLDRYRLDFASQRRQRFPS